MYKKTLEIKKELIIKKNNEIEIKLLEIESKEVSKVIIEAEVRALLSDFSGYVISRNIPKSKKLIRGFVKEVIVFKYRIEVTFNVAFFCSKIENEQLKLHSINRYDLFERYINSFYNKSCLLYSELVCNFE